MGQRRGGFARVGFRRVGAAATTGGGTVSSVGSADGTVAVTSPTTTPDLSVAASLGLISARWTIGLCRVYALDGVNGDDTHTGYADPATSSAADYATACAAAGVVARKTFAGLAAILPKNGAGRTAEIVVLGGGTTYTGALSTFLQGCHSYVGGHPAVRGTVTAASAQCVAFDGSVADCTMVGAATAAGMNAAGYVPTGVPTTTSIQLLQVGGAAPGFPAETALPDGACIRFDNSVGTTTNALLRNVRRQIHKVAGTDTVTFNQALPAIPAATDILYVEMPGVITTDAEALSIGDNQAATALSAIAQIAGIGFPSSFLASIGAWALAFCSTGTSMAFGPGRTFTPTRLYTHPVRGTITVGGTRVGTTLSVSDAATLSTSSVFVVSNTFVTRVGQLVLPAGVYAGGLTLSQVGMGAAGGGGLSIIGSTAGSVGVSPRILGTGFVTLTGASVNIAQLAIEGTPTNCFVVNGIGNHVEFGAGASVANSIVTGTASQFGMDLYSCRDSTFAMHWDGGQPSITGGTAVFRLGNGMGSGPTFAQLVANLGGFRDGGGHSFVGFFAQNSGVANIAWRHPMYLAGAVFGAAGAQFSYMNGAGGNVANLATPYSFPSGVRECLVLRFKPTTNSLTHAATVTLYKNGSATALQVSIPAGTTAMVSIFDFNTTPALVFAAVTDVFDVRIDAPAGDAGNSMAGSALLEWA